MTSGNAAQCGPSDDLDLVFEARAHLDPDERAMIRQLIHLSNPATKDVTHVAS
jgi:hypothetical protein